MSVVHAQGLLTLAYRPLLDPLPVHDAWYWLLIPMAFFLSLGWKAVRVGDTRRLLRETLAMTVLIVCSIIGLGAGFYLLIEFVLPAFAPRV